MSRPVHVLATFQANPGKEKSVEEMLEGLVDPTHQEEGCISYILQRRIDKPGTFYMIETWRSTADFRKVVAGNPAKSQYGSLHSNDHTAKEISD